MDGSLILFVVVALLQGLQRIQFNIDVVLFEQTYAIRLSANNTMLIKTPFKMARMAMTVNDVM